MYRILKLEGMKGYCTPIQNGLRFEQGKRIQVNGKGGGWSQPMVTHLVAYTTIWEAAGQRSVIPAAGAAHFVAYATIFAVVFQIQ
jgi:hypothetical protein